MSRPLLLFDETLPDPLLARLDAAGRAAAWLIHLSGGRVLAANAAGAGLLGLRPGGSSPVLDASMPALARLRSLAAQPDSGANRDDEAVSLVFWGAAGAVRADCHVHLASIGSQPVAVVTARAEGVRTAPALFVGDDAAKLKEIARRIREGQQAARQERARLEADDATTVTSRETAKPEAPPAAEAASHKRDPTAERTVSQSLRASLAHELKTPLSAIVAAAEIMKDQRFGPLGTARYVGYATDIHGSAQHVLGVIERMLADSSDLLSKGAPLDFAEIDPGAVLEASVSQLVPLAERAGIALTLELSPRLPHVVADATSLRQIVFNLLTNALKFTERGGKVTVAARYGGDGPLKIAVSDTGPGMTRREVERLLGGGRGPHQRRHGSAGRAGLGLGLPLVKTLAAANGAEFLIESAPGQGTSASVVFGKDRVIPV
ncbi:MAG TPA: HAMP domain-containing sensor histidine kinase [Hyphomicrobium sp.]|nr:HAMP domain-containing sensor histidine kinase [Hyphomicrobium sp.]